MSVLISLEDYLIRNRIWHRFLVKNETIHTAEASKATGIDLHRITKNLISKTDNGEYVVLVIPGDRRVNLKAASIALGVKNVKLIPFNQSEQISGYPPGGTPSLGFKMKMRVVLDYDLDKFSTFYCGGGTRGLLLEVRLLDVKKFNDAISAPITI